MLKKLFFGAMFALTLTLVTPASTLTVHAGFTSEDEGGSSEFSSSDSGSSDSGSSDSGSSDSGSSEGGSSDEGSSSDESNSSDEGGSSDEGNSSDEGGSSDEGNSSDEGQDSSDEGGSEAPAADPEPSEEPTADPTPAPAPAPETDADDGSHDNGGSHHSDSSSSSSAATPVVVEEAPVVTIEEAELPALAIPVLPVVEETAAVEPVAAEEVAVAEAPVAKAAAVQEEEVYSCTYSGVRHIAEEPEMIPETEDDAAEVVIVPEEEAVMSSDLLALLAILGLMVIITLFVLSDQYDVVLVTADGEEIVDDETPIFGFRRIVRYVAGLDFDDEEYSEKLDDVVRIEIRNRYRDNEDDPEQNIVYGFTRMGDEYTVYCSNKEGLVLYDELGFDYKAALEAATDLSNSKMNPGAMPA